MEKYYVDKALTQVAVARKRPMFLAERVLPVVNHDELTGKYWKFDTNDAALIPQGTERAPGRAPKALYSEPPTTDDFTIKDHALEDALPDEYNAPSVAFERESRKVEKLIDAIDLDKETKVLAALAAGVTNLSAPSEKFDDADPAVDPITFLTNTYSAVEEAIGATPNAMAMDVKVARAIINHKLVRENVKYTVAPDRFNIGLAQMEMWLAAMLGLDEVIIATGSFRNNAKKKATKSIARTWSDNILLFYKEQPSLEYAGLGIMVKWNPPAEQGEGVVNGKLVERERLSGGRKAWGFYVHDYYVPLITSPLAGAWIPDVLT